MLNRCVSTSHSKMSFLTYGIILGCLLVLPTGVWAQVVETPTETPAETPTVAPVPTNTPAETSVETPTPVPPTNTPVPAYTDSSRNGCRDAYAGSTDQYTYTGTAYTDSSRNGCRDSDSNTGTRLLRLLKKRMKRHQHRFLQHRLPKRRKRPLRHRFRPHRLLKRLTRLLRHRLPKRRKRPLRHRFRPHPHPCQKYRMILKIPIRVSLFWMDMAVCTK